MKRNSLFVSAVILSVTLIGTGPGNAAPDLYQTYAEALGATGATRVQTMISTGITSIVQNAADGQQVQRFATVTVDVAGMRNMLAQLGQNRVMENAISARRAIPR